MAAENLQPSEKLKGVFSKRYKIIYVPEKRPHFADMKLRPVW